MEPIITLENISFAYDKEIVFDNFNLQIQPGDLIFCKGPNGCGKSTLFKIINGLIFPQRGTYYYKQQLINQQTLKNYKIAKTLHKEIGFVFQNPELQLFNGSVYEEIAFGPRQMAMTEAEVNARVESLIQLLNIGKLTHRAPFQLSGGEQKKVAIAAVLALNPEVLIMDEPFNGLDRKSRQWLTDFLETFHQAGKTLIIATHEDSLLSMARAKIIQFPDD